MRSCVDVRDPDAVEAVAAAAVERFGALHIAVNNAGIVNGATPGSSRSTTGTGCSTSNLWGVIHGVRRSSPASSPPATRATS